MATRVSNYHQFFEEHPYCQLTGDDSAVVRGDVVPCAFEPKKGGWHYGFIPLHGNHIAEGRRLRRETWHHLFGPHACNVFADLEVKGDTIDALRTPSAFRAAARKLITSLRAEMADLYGVRKEAIEISVADGSGPSKPCSMHIVARCVGRMVRSPAAAGAVVWAAAVDAGATSIVDEKVYRTTGSMRMVGFGKVKEGGWERPFVCTEKPEGVSEDCALSITLPGQVRSGPLGVWVSVALFGEESDPWRELGSTDSGLPDVRWVAQNFLLASYHFNSAPKTSETAAQMLVNHLAFLSAGAGYPLPLVVRARVSVGPVARIHIRSHDCPFKDSAVNPLAKLSGRRHPWECRPHYNSWVFLEVDSGGTVRLKCRSQQCERQSKEIQAGADSRRFLREAFAVAFGDAPVKGADLIALL